MTLVLGDWPPETMSVAEKMATLSEAERTRLQSMLSQSQIDALRWDWDFWARPDQQVPDDCLLYAIVAGRGSGKSKALNEWIRKKGPNHREGLIIGANPRDVRDIILEGRSGLLQISPPWERPTYEPTKLLVRWPNGAVAYIRSAEDPEGIRGLSAEWMAGDEMGKWRFMQETWDQARLALREGRNVQTVIATTPTPAPLIKKLVSGKGARARVAPRMSTYRNAANLAPEYLKELLDTYEGTRLGDQEIHGMILEDVKGALWNWEMIEGARWHGEWIETPTGLWVPALSLRRRVVGVDPSGSPTGDECGIIVVGTDGRRPPCGFVLDDRSMKGTAEEWSREVVRTYFDHDCEAIIAEVNYGGEMVERSIRAVSAEAGYPSGENVRIHVVRAGRGQSKYERAIPIVGLFEQNLRGFRRFYLVGVFKDMEAEMTTWVAPEAADGIEVFASKRSPNRLDACVWASLWLLVMNPRRQGHAETDVLLSATIG